MVKRNTVQEIEFPIEEDEFPVIWVNDFELGDSKNFSKDMMKLNADPDVSDIFVYITSYGGLVFPMIAMIDTMMLSKKPVHTVGMGLCASAASALLTCGTGTRWITPNSYIHIHHVRGGTFGDVPSQEQDIKHSKTLDDKLFNLITKNSKMTVQELKEKLQNEEKEWQMSARTALKYGFVDKIGVPSFKKYMVTEYE